MRDQTEPLPHEDFDIERKEVKIYYFYNEFCVGNGMGRLPTAYFILII
jgi:hypothetical protein